MIAILTHYPVFALEWIRKEYDVKLIFENQRRVILVNDVELRIITRIEDAVGLEFERYRKAPDYDYLEDYIKTRIKK